MSQRRRSIILAVLLVILTITSPLMLTAIAAIGLGLWMAIKSWKQRSKWRAAFALICVLLSIVGGILGLVVVERFNYNSARWLHMLTLHTTLWRYSQEHGGQLPDRLAQAEALGYFGQHPYRLPANGWERTEFTGPAPHYLPFKAWKRRAVGPFIVAVEARTPRSGQKRGYVLATPPEGDPPSINTTSHRATEEQLEQLLKEDDALREKHDDPGRWSDIPWQSSSER